MKKLNEALTVTLREIAALMGVSMRTVGTYHAEGRIPGRIRLRGRGKNRILYSRRIVQDWLNGIGHNRALPH